MRKVGTTPDLVLNACFIWFLGTPTATPVGGNIGYVLAFVIVLVGFLALRRTQPGRPHPIRRGWVWIPIAFLLAILNAVFLIAGTPSYGLRPAAIGVGVLLISVVLWAFRRWSGKSASATQGNPLALSKQEPAVIGG